ncbi:hypothetical protein LIER_09619 [Lithospermum erythrorhizon]|uniref:Gag-pol polyprotein n=1 Tax=Lithospermum erythrorhizon TaxID=34254 RepID=A0AAV3PIN1_LITER
MEGFRERGSTIRLPTWKVVRAGWTTPTDTNENVVTVKPEDDWTAEEQELAIANDKAMNAIFNVVDLNVFKLINTCTEAMTAWDTLQTSYEGTLKVRMSRLQQLIMRFEALRVEEDESIAIYNNTLKEMTNESFLLGEPMSNEKLVRKVLRTLPKKFAHKVTTIQEVQDLTTMSLDELIGNLTTFEMSLNERETSKKKGIALKASYVDVNDEELGETINMLAKNLNKILKRFNKKPFTGSVSPSVTDRNNNRWKKLVKEYIGFGHIQAECPNYLKKQSKNYTSTLSDDESKDGQDDELNNFVAFAGVLEPTVTNIVDENSEFEEDMTNEDV